MSIRPACLITIAAVLAMPVQAAAQQVIVKKGNTTTALPRMHMTYPAFKSARARKAEELKARQEAEAELLKEQKAAEPALTKADVEAMIDAKLDKKPKAETPPPVENEGVETDAMDANAFGKIGGIGSIGGIGQIGAQPPLPLP